MGELLQNMFDLLKERKKFWLLPVIIIMRTEMDYLVIGNFIFDKKEQPKWSEAIDWREEYRLD